MTIWTRICYSNIFSSILYSNCCIPSCAEDDEEDDEDGAVEAVVDVPQSRSLHLKFFTAWSDWCEILGRACYLDKADGGESSGENDEKSNCLSDRGMLDLEKKTGWWQAGWQGWRGGWWQGQEWPTYPEDVSAEKPLKLVVLKPVPIKNPREDSLVTYAWSQQIKGNKKYIFPNVF